MPTKLGGLKHLVFPLAYAVFGCSGDASISDASVPFDSGSDAQPSFDASDDTDAQIDGSGSPDSAADSGTPSLNTPGGPILSAPIVGCEDAERPARRDDAASAICDATGTGRCWYVSPEGDDTAVGSFDAPFRTGQQAAQQAAAGDIIYLRGGVYDDANAHDSEALRWDDPSRGVRRAFLSIGRVVLPEWAGGRDYTVASGTASDPIVVRSFPGERACISGAGSIRVGSLTAEIAHWRLENITLREGAVFINGGNSGGTHDIDIHRSEIYAFRTPGQNIGLVRINRGDTGGPSRITVESNILHDIIPVDDGIEHTWQTTTDAEHYGAVATLSCETYLGIDCGGNGELSIRNNHIYHVPQAFYFKNPTAGPVNVSGNVIHDVGSLGKWSASNISFTDNLVYAAGSIDLGLRQVGAEEDDGIYARTGHNLQLERNTFIGFDRLVSFKGTASGHTIRGNVFEGLRTPLAEASWDNMGLIIDDARELRPNTNPDITASQLATDNDFDDNCFVTGVSDFIAYGRRVDPGGGVQLTHLNLEDARTILGYESSSDVADTETAFMGFSTGDYRVSSIGACVGRGAIVPAWAP